METGDDVERRKLERWHVGKEIPVAIIFLLVAQSSAGIWWAATMTAKIDSIISIQALNTLETNRRLLASESRIRDLEQRHFTGAP